MLSVIIPTSDSAADLQGLLATLVPAAMDGLVREVICADAGSTDPTLEICEDTGAQVVAGGLVAAAKAAKSDWLLLLPVDIQLPVGWAEAMKAHLMRGKRPAVVRGAREPGLAGRFKTVPAGLLVEASRVVGQPENRDVKVLVRALGTGAARL
jgi:glycosyltransferase involved in cell wall biosynthesis